MFKVAIAIASPRANWAIVLEVGTIDKPASLTSGISNLISDALYNTEFFLETIPINIILFLFAYWIIGFNSSVLPELLIKISTSFLDILPKSPCKQSLADREKEGVPTEDRVAEILAAISPLFPTPHRITFDWQFEIVPTASLKELLIELFNFFRAFISKSITFFAIFL